MPEKASDNLAEHFLRVELGRPIEFDLDALRPRTRGECRDGMRPCPWIACRHHLYIEVIPETGSLKLNFPNCELEDLEETCSIDVAERGGITLDEIGKLQNLTRERVRQLELRALAAPQLAAFRNALSA